MTDPSDLLFRFLSALEADDTLKGQWSFSQGRLNLSGPFYETWIRLKHAAALAPLEKAGNLTLHIRKPRRRPDRQPLKGEWNAFALHALERVQQGDLQRLLIQADVGAGKTFLARHVLGSEVSLVSVKKLARQMGQSRRARRYEAFEVNWSHRPVLVLDDAHLLFESPALCRWLPRLLELRGPRPFVALARSGPGWDRIPERVHQLLNDSLQVTIDKPDSLTRRQLARLFLLLESVRVESTILSALCSRPMTPGSLRLLIRQLKALSPADLSRPAMIRELLRVSHTENLEDLFQHVCDRYRVSAHDLRSRRRPENLQAVRQEVAHLALAAGWRPAEVGHLLARSARGVEDLARRFGQ